MAESEWPKEWADVPTWARFRCGRCDHPIIAFRSCPKCHPEGWIDDAANRFLEYLKEGKPNG